MVEEKVRLMYLANNGLDIKQVSFTWKTFSLFLSGLIVLFIAVASLGIYLLTDIFQSYEISSLENDRERLQTELLVIKERVSELGARLEGVEETGDQLRNVANLDPIDEDVRQVGVGGSAFYGSLNFDYYPDEIGRTAVEVQLDLDKLERAIRLEKTSMTEITQALLDQQVRIDNCPSIRPITDGYINSRFGFRIDPLLGRRSFHYGVDFPSRIGTPVLATGGGVVKVAKTAFKPHKSYGMEVVIDHGNGYETRYAHLSKIYVRPGQKVKRWEPIAEVGNTGKTSGPHLHYEVMSQGEKENPEDFILN